MIPPVVGGFGVALLWERGLQRNADLAYQEAMTGTTDEHLAWGYQWLRRSLDETSKEWYGAWPAGAAWRRAMGITRRPAPPPLVLGGAVWRGAVGATWAPSSLAGTSFWVRADALLRAGELGLAIALLAALILAGPVVERGAFALVRRDGRCFVPLPVGGRLRASSYFVSRLRGALLATIVLGVVSAGAPILIGTSYLHNVAGGVVWLSAMVALGFVCMIAGGAWRCFPRMWSPGDLWTCARCRYQAGATFPARCPECGLTSGDVPRCRRLLVFPARWRPYMVIFLLSAVVVMVHWAAVTPPARPYTVVRLPRDLPTELVWGNGVRARIIPPEAPLPSPGELPKSGLVWKCVWSDEAGVRGTQDVAGTFPAWFEGPRGCEIEFGAGIPTDGAVVYGRLVKIERARTVRK